MPKLPSCSLCRQPLPADCSTDVCPDCQQLGETAAAPASSGDSGSTRHYLAAAESKQHPAFANYELLEEVGRGAMGVVYKARQVRAARVVALKIMLGAAESEPELRARFRTEAQSLARLRHPNIVQIYDVDEEEGRPFFSMEFVAGGNLGGKLKSDGPLPPAQAAALTETLATAVEAAHQAGVLHRDLKPGNVLLAEDGTPKITDFGLAKRLDADDAMTQTGAVLGTPAYMAPEQAAGRNRDVSPRTDVYALGATLYALLTTTPPFHADTVAATLQRVLHDDPVPPRRLRREIPPELEAICLKCLEKDPARRYDSARDLAGDLDRFCRGEPTRARPLTVFGKAWRGARRRPLRTLALALLPFCLFAALLGLWQANPRWQNALDLDRDKPVTLVGETGLPRWSRWRQGAVPLVPSGVVQDGTCSFQAADDSVLELLPDTRVERYRLTAELRQDASYPPAPGKAPVGRVGLYFAARSYPEAGPRVTGHWLAVTFSEFGTLQFDGTPGPAHVRLDDEIVFSRPGRGTGVTTLSIGSARFKPAGSAQRWRKIVVEMFPDRGEVYWEDDDNRLKMLGAWSHATEGQLFDANLPHLRQETELADLTLRPPAPRGPIGVYASGGAISVRNVVIVPSPSTPLIQGEGP